MKTAIIHPAAEGGYWAEVPAMSGCITEGETREEVIANLKDAIKGWIEVASSRYVAKITVFKNLVSPQSLELSN